MSSRRRNFDPRPRPFIVEVQGENGWGFWSAHATAREAERTVGRLREVVGVLWLVRSRRKKVEVTG